MDLSIHNRNRPQHQQEEQKKEQPPKPNSAFSTPISTSTSSISISTRTSTTISCIKTELVCLNDDGSGAVVVDCDCVHCNVDLDCGCDDCIAAINEHGNEKYIKINTYTNTDINANGINGDTNTNTETDTDINNNYISDYTNQQVNTRDDRNDTAAADDDNQHVNDDSFHSDSTPPIPPTNDDHDDNEIVPQSRRHKNRIDSIQNDDHHHHRDDDINLGNSSRSISLSSSLFSSSSNLSLLTSSSSSFTVHDSYDYDHQFTVSSSSSSEDSAESESLKLSPPTKRKLVKSTTQHHHHYRRRSKRVAKHQIKPNYGSRSEFDDEDDDDDSDYVPPSFDADFDDLYLKTRVSDSSDSDDDNSNLKGSEQAKQDDDDGYYDSVEESNEDDVDKDATISKRRQVNDEYNSDSSTSSSSSSSSSSSLFDSLFRRDPTKNPLRIKPKTTSTSQISKENHHHNNQNDRNPIDPIEPENESHNDDFSEHNSNDDDESTSPKRYKQPTRFKILSLKCWICDRSFVADKFDEHLRRWHRIERYRCVAPNCRASFPCRNQLNHHKQTVHQLVTSYPCGWFIINSYKSCKKRYDSAQSLSVHIHTQHRSGHFKCAYPYCKFECRSTNRQEMINHYEWVHNNSSVAKYRCKHCLKRFKYRGQLDEHEKIHDGGDGFICHQCSGKQFTSEARLQAHVRLVHRGTSRWYCKWNLRCRYFSSSADNVAAHVRLEHFTQSNDSKKRKNRRNAEDYIEKRYTQGERPDEESSQDSVLERGSNTDESRRLTHDHRFRLNSLVLNSGPSAFVPYKRVKV